MKTVSICLLLLSLIALPTTANAQEEVATEQAAPSSPFDKQLALAVYGTGHAGSYLAGGVGGRLRWEFFEWLGVEAYLEATLVDWPGGIRHDYPNGFSFFVPIRAGDFRFRPYLGICDILSFIEPEQPHAPRAGDVLIGARPAQASASRCIRSSSVFADLQANFYAGHVARGGWTGGVGGGLHALLEHQLNIGVQARAEPMMRRLDRAARARLRASRRRRSAPARRASEDCASCHEAHYEERDVTARASSSSPVLAALLPRVHAAWGEARTIAASDATRPSTLPSRASAASRATPRSATTRRATECSPSIRACRSRARSTTQRRARPTPRAETGFSARRSCAARATSSPAPRSSTSRP
jgi:hypothetical protein